MTVSQRIRMCRMAEAIQTDKEYADRIQIKDRSYFRYAGGIEIEDGSLFTPEPVTLRCCSSHLGHG